jgi:hypothetical protein
LRPALTLATQALMVEADVQAPVVERSSDIHSAPAQQRAASQGAFCSELKGSMT